MKTRSLLSLRSLTLGLAALLLAAAQPHAAAAPAFRLDGLPADAPSDGSEPMGFAAPAAPPRAVGPQPQTSSQDAYVDSSNTAGAGNVYLGATYTVPAGGAAYGDLYDGYDGTGAVTQTQGTFTVSGILSLADQTGSSNGTYNLSGGTLASNVGYIGTSGTGTFNQSGGTYTVAGGLFFSYNQNASGTYNLSGTGTLSVGGTEYLGYDGPSYFTQGTGTVHTVSGNLNLGYYGGVTYTLNGGTLTTASTQVGLYTYGCSFTQNGGTHTTNLLALANGENTAAGTYSLNGGTLKTGQVVTGNQGGTGTSTFNFNGGTLQASANSTAFFGGLTTANVQANGALIDSQTYSVTVSQPLLTGTASGTADGGITKLGTGALTLTGNNTYSGPTKLNAGTLLVNGINSGTGTVTVAGSGSTLGGTGTLAGPVNVTTGRLNPGNNAGAAGSAANVGNLTVGALTLSSTAATVFDLNGGTAYDQVQANGNVALAGTLTLNVPTQPGFTAGQVLDLFHASGGALSGTFSDFANAGSYTYGSDVFRANYTGTDFTLTVTSVPEPATWAGGALLLGATVLTLRRRRRA